MAIQMKHFFSNKMSAFLWLRDYITIERFSQSHKHSLSDRLLKRILSPITHSNCVIGKFFLTISDPVHFEVNWVFKATKLANINVVRENTENFPRVSNNIYYIS